MAIAKKTKRTKREVSSVEEKVSINETPKTSGWSTINVVAIIIALAIVALVGIGFDKIKQNKTATSTKQEVAAVSAIAYNGEEGKNALELLKSKAKIETQDSSIGTFVVSINGTPNTDTQYWMFYVNDELAPISADQYQTKNNDKIEWRYETFE